MFMKKDYLIIILGAALFLNGCKTLPKSSVSALTPAEKGGANVTQQSQNYNITVAVVPFAEKRAAVNKYGSVYRYLVPLAPYGTIRYERPEEARMFNTVKEFKFNITESLAKTFFDELQRVKIFDKVIFTHEPKETDADLILSGEVNSTLYEGKTYSYGISFLCPVLWTLGLPAGSSYNKLNIKLYLKKADTEELIWSYSFNKEKVIVQGLYYNWGKDLYNYESLIQEGMKAVTDDLKRKLSGIPLESLKVKRPEPAPPAPAPQEPSPPQPSSPPEEPQPQAQPQTTQEENISSAELPPQQPQEQPQQ